MRANERVRRRDEERALKSKTGQCVMSARESATQNGRERKEGTIQSAKRACAFVCACAWVQFVFAVLCTHESLAEFNTVNKITKKLVP